MNKIFYYKVNFQKIINFLKNYAMRENDMMRVTCIENFYKKNIFIFFAIICCYQIQLHYSVHPASPKFMSTMQVVALINAFNL